MEKMISLPQVENYMIGLGFSKVPPKGTGCPDPFPKFYFNVDNTDYHYDIVDFKFNKDGSAVIDFDFYYGKYELSKYIVGYNKRDKYKVTLSSLDYLYNLFLENEHMAPFLRDKQIEKILK